MLANPFSEDFLPDVQLEPSLSQLEAVSSCPVASYLGEEADLHLVASSFQEVGGGDVVSPELPLLQAK